MRSKLLIVVSVLVVLSMVLSGCGATPTPQVIEKQVTVVVEKEKVVPETVIVQQTKVVEKQVEKVVTATPKPAPATKPKMTFWMNYNFEEAVNIVVRDQVKTWGQINGVDMDILIAKDADLATKWAAGMEAPDTLPDVSTIFLQWMPKFFDAGLLLDVSDAYAEANKYAGGFLPAAKDVMTIAGKQYAVPYIGSVTPVYWRTDMLQKAGLTTAPKTYDEMFEACKKINVKGEFWCYGFNFGGYSDNEVQMSNLIWSYGGGVVAKDGKTITINSPEVLAVLKWIKAMQDAGSFPPDAVTADDSGNNKYYQTKVVATIINTGSVLAWMKTNDADLLKNTILTLPPEGPKGRGVGGGFGGGLGAFKKTKYPDLAKSLVAWFCHPDRVWARTEAVKFGNLPVHVDAAKDPIWQDPYLKPFIDTLPYSHATGWPGPVTTAAMEVQNQLVLSRMAVRVVTGEQTPEQSIKQAEEEVKKIYAQFPPKL